MDSDNEPLIGKSPEMAMDVDERIEDPSVPTGSLQREHQFQYIHQQQMAFHAFSQQFKNSDLQTAESTPIEIPHSGASSDVNSMSHYHSISDSNRHDQTTNQSRTNAGPATPFSSFNEHHITTQQASTSQPLISSSSHPSRSTQQRLPIYTTTGSASAIRQHSIPSSLGIRPGIISPSSETSSFFSTSYSSRFVPFANEPSSVSSSYKSAVMPGAGSMGHSPFNSSTRQRGDSLVNPGGGHSFSGERNGPTFFDSNPEPSWLPKDVSGAASSDMFFRSTNQYASAAPRTSLLTSKLSASLRQAANNAMPPTQTNDAPNRQSPSIPFPINTSSSQAEYSSDPHLFNSKSFSATNNIIQSGPLQNNDPDGEFSSGLGISTNITMALASGLSSAASSTETLSNDLPNYDSFAMDQSTLARFAPSSSAPTKGLTHSHSLPQMSTGAHRQMLLESNQRVHEHRSRRHEHLDIANHSVSDIINMLTALLKKIIDSNDALRSRHANFTEMDQTETDEELRIRANVLAFHGRNVPAISLHAYLSRILKYCPTTNEVFISLLVYFDRIAQRANAGHFSKETHKGTSEPQLFVMDSYNIHRLIIAGVTVASKFFSDIFYKNSRYAKVGGLPVEELNHLELQFLLLTDFSLMINLEELQRYADLLLRFWKKEKAYHPAKMISTAVGD